MSDIIIHQFNCLSDNFGVLIHSQSTGETATIDVPDAAEVEAALNEKGWNLTHIFVTHHHWDHTQGIEALKKQTGCHVIGPKGEADKIDTLDESFSDNDQFQWAGVDVHVIETPGHTLGMINYHIPSAKVVFTGDTLFSLGCGRIFEGTAQMMWQSLEKLMKLPGDTEIYCGHEYTLSNAKFALTIDPDNADLQARVKEVENLRAQNLPTLPTRMDAELKTNPFLRASDPAIRKNLGLENAEDWEIFAEIRKRKDNS